MSDKNDKSSRREFLKQTLRMTGYAVPFMVAFSMNSREAWAENYGSGGESKNSDGKCNATVEKIFNPSCW